MKKELDKNFIKEKISLIFRDLERLEKYRDLRFYEAARDYVIYAAVKNFLMEIIGRGIDINEHIIANLEKSGITRPKSYTETFLVLRDLKILPNDFAQEISKSAGFRNAIVHDYNNLDQEIVYKSVGQAVDQYSQYCAYVFDFLDKV